MSILRLCLLFIQEMCRSLGGDCMESVTAFGNMSVFTMLVLLTPEHRRTSGVSPWCLVYLAELVY